MGFQKEKGGKFGQDRAIRVGFTEEVASKLTFEE